MSARQPPGVGPARDFGSVGGDPDRRRLPDFGSVGRDPAEAPRVPDFGSRHRRPHAGPSMTDPILVGLALRDDDAAVVALAHELATATGAPLAFCHAYPFQPLIAIPPPEWVQELQAQCEARLRSAAGDAPAICRAGPSPAGALHEVADELGAALIVVGSSHRGRVGRVLPGGVGEHLLHSAPCPVAIAPRGYAQPPDGLRRIGVASAGGAETEPAFALADVLAGTGGGDVTLYTVLTAGAPDREPPDDAVALHGDVATELAAISGELDLLLTGSRGYGPLRSRLASGVTAELAHTARCPLIVVGRAQPVADTGKPAADEHRLPGVPHT